MYQALYRTYRPETFDSLVGQEHIVRMLKNQIASGTTGHAYLFCGTRGTGKTTTARLLAKALNCTSSEGDKPCGHCEACMSIAKGLFVDVVEIDAASYNGVDDVRELRESVNYPPVSGRTKVYIMDEAHMLTSQASNALLKTLEEPPEHVVFILATTEPNRLPATILSRCIRMDFRRVSESVIMQRFKDICKEMGVSAADDALGLIAANADGSVRDGLSILDRCISGTKEITRDDVLSLLGMAGVDVYIHMTDMVLRGSIGEVLTAFGNVLSEGKEVNQFAKDWVEHFRNLMIIKYVSSPEQVLNLSTENIKRLKKQSDRASIDAISLCIAELSSAIAEAKWSPKPRIIVELAMVRMCSAAGQGEKQASQGTQATQASRPSAESSRKAETAEAPITGNTSEPAFKPSEKHEAAVDVASAEPSPERAAPVEKATEPSSERNEATEAATADSSPENAIAEASGDADALTSLWSTVMEDDGISPMIRMATTVLRGMNDKEFTVQVSNSVIGNQLKESAVLLQQLVERETGKKLKLVTIVKEV